MSSFYDDTDTLVLDGLKSMVIARPGLALDEVTKTIWAKDLDRQQVALLSGGGAGHEPAHAGYVGKGMLTAAVSGSVFASPSVAQIVAAIKHIARPAGVLLILKNYTGDVFHFHLAAEKAKASLGIPIEVLIVGDDVAIGRQKSGKVGRRGLAGTVLVHKILGAFSAQEGTALADVVALGNQVVQNLVTVGVSLEHVSIPGRPKALETGDDQVELGMGIHNELGSQVVRPRPALPVLIDAMLNQLLNQDDTDRGYVDFSDAHHIVLLVNNLGGLSPLEFGGITTIVLERLAARELKPDCLISGTLMASLNGPGFSITLLKATPSMIECLDAPTTALGWVSPVHNPQQPPVSGEVREMVTMSSSIRAASGRTVDWNRLKSAVTEACERVKNAEPTITEHDTYVGDGDCGITLARGADAILAYLKSSDANNDAVKFVADITELIENNMDGTSGAVYSIFFAALASALTKGPFGSVTAETWSMAASAALSTLHRATPARPGDRTLMDALEPFVKALDGGANLLDALSAARAGTEATKGMKASLGRSVYVQESAWAQVPDPGAEGVLSILEGLVWNLVGITGN